MSEPFTRADLVDSIATAIDDSMGPDWNSHVGAEAIVQNCGVFELFQFTEQLERVALFELNKFRNEGDDEGVRLRQLNLNLIRATIAKVRGEA